MKKIVLGFVLLLALYSTLLCFVKPSTYFSVNQVQANQIILEQMMFEHRECSTVFTGSSLFSRFEEAYLPKEYCNFALGGDSAMTALETMSRLAIYPKKLFIELNVLMDADAKMLSGLFEEPYLTFKKIFPFLRSCHQPFTLLYTVLRSTKSNIHFSDAFDPRVYQVQLKNQVSTFEHLEPKVETIQKAGTWAKAFSAQGTNVQFIELPVDPLAENTVFYSKLHEIEKILPIPVKALRCPDVQTTDGIHLTSNAVRACIETLLKL